MKRHRKSPLSASGCADAFCRVAPIAAWWLLAVFAICVVAGSVCLTAVSFHRLFPAVPRELTFCGGVVAGLFNPVFVAAFVKTRCGKGHIVLACVLFFLVLILNWSNTSFVFVPLFDGISFAELWLVGAIFVLEMLSGGLPALIILLHETEGHASIDKNAGIPTRTIDPRRHASSEPALVAVADAPYVGCQPVVHRWGVARELGITTVRDLVVYAGSNPKRLPELKFGAGVMFASLETIGNVLGMAKSTVHKHLRKEAAAGLILFDTRSRPTKVWIPVDHAPIQPSPALEADVI